jgi:hypothetical protein
LDIIIEYNIKPLEKEVIFYENTVKVREKEINQLFELLDVVVQEKRRQS